MNRLFLLSILLCLLHGTSRADEASAVEAFKKAGFADTEEQVQLYNERREAYLKSR